MTVDSIPMTASGEREKASAPVWRIRVGTRLSRAAAIAGLAVVVVLALLPMIASRNLIQDLIFVFTMLALAQLWNVLAGWGGLVSVGQQAFVGLGAYALFAGVVVVGIVVGFDGSGSVHFERKLPRQYRKRNAHCKAQNRCFQRRRFAQFIANYAAGRDFGRMESR